MHYLKKLAAVALTSALVVAPMASQAALIVRVSDGISSLDIGDNTTLDDATDLGIINWDGSFGGYRFVLALATGTVDPMEMHLTAAVSGTGSSRPVSIMFTQTDLVAGAGPTTFVFDGGGSGGTGTAASWSTYVDDSNAAFGTGTVLSSTAGFATAAGSSTTALSGDYSATIGARFDFSAVPSTMLRGASIDASLKVPEPGTLALLGAALAAVGFMRRRSVPAQ